MGFRMASVDLNPANSSFERAAPLARFATVDLVRLGALLFILPNALFALSLGALPQALVLLGCLGATVLLWRPSAALGLLAEQIDARMLAACAGLALTLCVLGGEGHFFYANADWLARDGVLADLVDRGYPVFYHYQDRDFLLRAPLGMYMTPALVGRGFGLHAAHMALLAQNAALLTPMLYLVARLARPHAALVLGLMTLFSGLDIVPAFVVEIARHAAEGLWGHLGHIEWWNPYVQYSSHVTQLFWAPNHALPGWWMAVLILLFAHGEIGFSALVAMLAPLVFWAPLPMLGALPSLTLWAFRLSPSERFAPRNLLAVSSGLCFLPVAFYLTRDAGDNPHRLLLALPDYWMLYGLFLLVEIPHAALLYVAWPRLDARDRPALLVSFALLIALPAFEFGHSNDLAMRASIPPLFLLAFAYARLCADLIGERPWTKLQGAALTIALLSAVTPALEIARAFLPAFAISDCNFLTTWRKSAPKSNGANYLASVDSAPEWLLRREGPRKELEQRQCWPDHPLLEETRR